MSDCFIEYRITERGVGRHQRFAYYNFICYGAPADRIFCNNGF